MTFRVEMLEDDDVRVGRGLISYKKGWKGPVKEEVFKKLMTRKTAKDISPKAKHSSTKPASKQTDG